MGVFSFSILFSFIFLYTMALHTNSQSVNCSDGGPDIRFPFQLQGHQVQLLSHPSFELFCKLNKTTIHFPSYGDLVVNSISYDNKKLNLLDPKNCVHEVFLNLNLSLTPFHYYYVVKNYTYLNCSTRLSPSFVQVPCLSGSEYHVYIVEPSLGVPVLCRSVKSVAIPFSYTPYISDNSFGLGLTWDETCCEGSEANGSGCGFPSNIKVLQIAILVFMVATMVSAKSYYSKKFYGHSERKNQFEVEKLLGDSLGDKSGSVYKGKVPNETSISMFKTTSMMEMVP